MWLTEGIFLHITIVRLYRVAMFVLHVDSFQARALFAPRSRAVKKPCGATLSLTQIWMFQA